MTLAHVPRTRIDRCPTCKLSVSFEEESWGEFPKWHPGRHLAPCGTACFGGGVSDDLYMQHAVHGSLSFPCPKGCPGTGALAVYLDLYETLSSLDEKAFEAACERLDEVCIKMTNEDRVKVSAHRIIETLRTRKSGQR